MKKVDGYLSRLIQNAWPDALVVCLIGPGAETWIIERAGEEAVGLGANFSEAKQAVHAILKAETKRANK